MDFVSYETKPTQEYNAYQAAYDRFNQELFGSSLPQCLITFQRTRNAYGYFWAGIYRNRNRKRTTDEIAINPEGMARPDLEILGTLAHEMAHLWQQHFGKPSRSGYHNREWASKMLEIGLVPSDTGQPGGKQTGQNMTHYIQPGGKFACVARRLLASGFGLNWHSLTAQPVTGKPAAGSDEDEDSGGEDRSERKNRNKVKYTCPACGLKAWAKPKAHIWCGECLQQMQPEA